MKGYFILYGNAGDVRCCLKMFLCIPAISGAFCDLPGIVFGTVGLGSRRAPGRAQMYCNRPADLMA